MRNKFLLYTIACVLLSSCSKLDLNPLSEASSEEWYTNDTQVRMSLDRLYYFRFWNPDPDPINFDNCGWLDSFSDDWTNRNSVSAIAGGTLNGQSSVVTNWWKFDYECIGAANTILAKLEQPNDNISKDKINQYIAEARFVRAAQYSKLIFHWGDVPYYSKPLNIDEAFKLGRTKKEEILKYIYDDFDFAASNLPTTYSSSEPQYATKGAALALKARIALYMGDWQVASDAAKACMDLEVYKLYPVYQDLFLSKTKNSEETVFGIPRSKEAGIVIAKNQTQQPLSRNASGNDYVQPSWDLLNAYLCTDGLPIDQSPRYNPNKPFKNRDPRCTATIVEFGTSFCGFPYYPHPDSLLTTNLKTGERVSNQDSRGVIQYASYNGLAWRKHIDDAWTSDFQPDPEITVIRYADVLLIYAEAKIELNDIDQTVLDAINRVRARAYGVSYTETSSYPAVTVTDQNDLRHILRIERRMEFAFEGLRYNDIIRWKIAEKVLNTNIYGMIDPEAQREKIIKKGLWFFPETPQIDIDGVSDFSSMYNKGYIDILAKRSFNKSKNYLWPIPTSEILINKNLTQNPGY